MDRWRKTGATVMMLAGNAERMERMRRVLDDYSIETPTLLEGNLQSGFELPSIPSGYHYRRRDVLAEAAESTENG